jgi:transmembrane sensor
MAATDERMEAEPVRLEAAAHWRVRLSEDGPGARADLQRWLAEDPRNRTAWRLAEELWAGLGELATEPQLLAARRDALHRARRASRARWRGDVGGLAAAVAASLIVTAGLGYVGWRALEPAHYVTALGERRVVRLVDGSVVTLDSGTRLDVRYSRDARRLWLRDGQARFDVAHDVTRPFQVRARDRTVVATGTSFNVEVLGPRVLVTLIEGRVTVLKVRATGDPTGARGLAEASTPLLPGQRLVADAASTTTVTRLEAADIDRVTAWEGGKLVFDDEPLASVAAQVSRYSDRPVVVSDRRAGDMRVSGVFSAGDLDTFVDTVTQYLPVSARTAPDGAVSLHSKP